MVLNVCLYAIKNILTKENVDLGPFVFLPPANLQFLFIYLTAYATAYYTGLKTHPEVVF